MKCNVGGADRGIRVIVGVVLLALAMLHVVTGTLAIITNVVGVIALATAVFRFCPAWSIFGIDTSTPTSTPANK